VTSPYLVLFLVIFLDVFLDIFFAVAFFRMLLISGWNSFQQAAISVPFFGVHQFCWINFRWRVVARDKFSLSIWAYWMGYALYSILYLAMFRQQTIFFDIYDCNFWKESFCTWSQTYRDQQWINWKHFFFFERKYLIMKSTSTISTNYSQDKNTHFLLFLNWNFYFLFVVTLIVVILRCHFYYTAVRWSNNYPAR